MFPGRKSNYSDRKQTNSDSSDQKGGTSSNVNVSSLSKKDASLIINSECCQNGPTPELDILMDYLFHPEERLDNPVSIEWVRWLIAGGRTPEEFASIGEWSELNAFQFKNQRSYVQQVQGQRRC